MAENFGVMPVYDVNNGMNDGFGGSWVWVIFLFFILCWGNNGFGGWGGAGAANLNGALTRAEMFEGFNDNNIVRKLDGITNGLSDGFYAQKNSINNAASGIQRSLCNISQEVQQARFDAQQCGCETNRNIDALRFDGERNTCRIENAIHSEGEATRALINANEMQNLRDRLEAKDRDLLTANFQLSQQAQTANIIDSVRPVSRPAYITCSPYEAAPFPYGGYGCGCGCSCGCN